MTDRCNACRFWKFAESGGEDDDGEGRPYGWGWCRRNPPAIVERMADMRIPQLGNRADNYDPENVATVSNVTDCSLFPGTWYDKWCGQFEPVAARGEAL